MSDDLIPRRKDGTPIPPENFENDVDPKQKLGTVSSPEFNEWWAGELAKQKAIVEEARKRK